VAHALAKVPTDRYASAKVFAEDIEDILAGQPPRHTTGRAPAPPPTTLVTTAEELPSGLLEPTARADGGEATARSGASAAALVLPFGKRVSLAVVDGPQKGTVFKLERPRALIGRKDGGAGADVEIADPQTSRAHALVECYGTRIVLRDLDSTNGTHVNERRVSEADLENGAEFRVGHTRLMLILTDAE
jgi:hypothetical protein